MKRVNKRREKIKQKKLKWRSLHNQSCALNLKKYNIQVCCHIVYMSILITSYCI